MLRHPTGRYTLIDGNMIGTVRHAGRIPWDDDLDIYIEFAAKVKAPGQTSPLCAVSSAVCLVLCAVVWVPCVVACCRQSEQAVVCGMPSGSKGPCMSVHGFIG